MSSSVSFFREIDQFSQARIARSSRDYEKERLSGIPVWTVSIAQQSVIDSVMAIDCNHGEIHNVIIRGSLSELALSILVIWKRYAQ